MENCSGRLSILIAEDEKTAAWTLTAMISRRFPEVACHLAENGRVGLELFLAMKPDIVVTDINMPEMDGIEMTIEMKKVKPDIRVIVLTAYNEPSYREKFTEIGFSHYLSKPIKFPVLFDAIEDCIEQICPSAGRPSRPPSSPGAT